MTVPRVVLDDWAQPPEPEPLAVQAPVRFQPDDGQFRRRLILDAMLTACVQAPGPLILVTGI
jgi:hypothetical protein